MGEKKRINGLIDGSVVDGVAKVAKDDNRSVSIMMEILLKEALTIRGYFKAEKK